MDIGNRPDINAKGIDWENIRIKFNDSVLERKKNLVVHSTINLYELVKEKYFVTPEHPEGTFAYVWNLLFNPAPPLKVEIQKRLSELKLVPGKFVSAHFRSQDHKFSKDEINGKGLADPKKVKYKYYQSNYLEKIENSLACAHQISPDKSFPIYFTSSNTESVKYALGENEFTKNNKDVKVVGITNVLRLHSDKPYQERWYFDEDRDPAELYPAFIDLYLMSYGACTSYGMLGFGVLGARISGEKCMIDSHRKHCSVMTSE